MPARCLIQRFCLRESGNILASARDLAIEGSHAAMDQTSFEAMAQQVDAMINRMLGTANTESTQSCLEAHPLALHRSRDGNRYHGGHR